MGCVSYRRLGLVKRLEIEAKKDYNIIGELHGIGYPLYKGYKTQLISLYPNKRIGHSCNTYTPITR